MALSGHQSVRMLERYTHPTMARKVDALEKGAGGRQEARTPDLRVANAALSQLS
jgi:hypothetical protein